MCQLCGDIVQHRPDREQDEARLIGIEFGHCFDPEEGVAFAVGVQLRHLRGNPIAHRFRASSGMTRRNSRKPRRRRRARISFIRSAGSAITFTHRSMRATGCSCNALRPRRRGSGHLRTLWYLAK